MEGQMSKAGVTRHGYTRVIEEIEEHEQQEEEGEPRSRSFLPFDPIVTFVLPV
jgi:hypothetical protein